MNKKTNPKIAVTGMGIVSPFGIGMKSYENALKNNSCAVRDISDTHPEHSKILPVAAFLKDTDISRGINEIECDELTKIKFRKLSMRTPLAIQASLLCSLEAYQQAKLSQLSDTNNVGIIVTGTNTSLAQTYDQHTIYLEQPNYVSSRYAVNFLDSSHIGYISELLNITGEGQVVGAASASGNMAIIQAMRLIELGVLDQCLVVGILAELSPVELQALKQLDVLGGKKFKLKPKLASRPFDSEHEGFIPGQISACLVLENAQSAKNRQVPILGYLLGAGVSLDANHSSNPTVAGEISAMKKALENADLEPSNIDYINAHGTSSILGDKAECDAIINIFGKNDKQYINSTKGLIGHGLWSAGVAEAIASLLQINEGFLHTNLNLINPIEQQAGLIREMNCQGKYKIALSNNFAFGGINTSIILQKGD